MTEHTLERRITIAAEPATVFRYFTDSARFAAWWGAGSTIDPRPGGKVLIRYPNAVTVSGEVLELVEGRRIVFTYGYDDPAKPIPPGGSRVTIEVERVIGGTLLTLRHDLADPATRDQHVPGWRYQLAVFANVVAREQHANLGRIADDWFAAWNEADAERRTALLERAATSDVAFRDQFGCITGVAELAQHIAAVSMHMPGTTLARDGEPAQCQGTALVRWVARKADGSELGRGVNSVELAPDGRLARVTGFWGA